MPDPLREQKSLPTNDVRVRYHGFSIFMHWLMALLIFALFAAGYWMVDLTYYSAWYKTAPHYHKSAGVVLALLLVVRWFWNWQQGKPAPLASHSSTVQRLSAITHALLYLLLVSCLQKIPSRV